MSSSNASGAGARRAVTVPAVAAFAVLLTVLAPLWVPLTIVADLVRGRWRLPLVRLLAFGACWGWLELGGVVGAGLLWITGQARRTAPHYAIQRWWASGICAVLRSVCGLRVEVEGIEALKPGPVIVLGRHASLADSVVMAMVVAVQARIKPRFVLKRELLWDPCLDTVGNRIPNHFVDRKAADAAAEHAALEALTRGIGAGECGVIFPEGTRANPTKRIAALARLAERDPDRAARLAALVQLMPPRPAGARAMLAGAPDADVVLAWHVGFEGLDTFPGVLRALAKGLPAIRLRMRRVARAEVPDGDGFVAWLDTTWLELDREVGRMLAEAGRPAGQ